MPKNGCLRVLSSDWGDEITYSRQSGYLVKAIPLSNPDLILTNAGKTANLPFLAEPKHTWCYYYTKAELARQQNDWDRVMNLYNEARSLGYESSDPFELLLFVEAQAMTGDIRSARKLSNSIYKLEQRTRKGLCQAWERVQIQSPAGTGSESQIDEILTEFQCLR
jgi:hypothetical protein